MTAERWWVRMAARWIARIDSVQGHMSLAFQAMTGVGVASGALKYYGMGGLTGPFLVVVAVGLLAYAYLYSEGGVWNQVSRDQSDLSNNFAVPRDVIDDSLIGAAVFAALHGRAPNEEEFEDIVGSVKTYWEGFRDGIDLDEHDCDAAPSQEVPADD